MGNLFTEISAPCANGSGAAADLSAFGAHKTIVVHGNWPSSLLPTINIEINNDPQMRGGWHPISTFRGPGTDALDVACRWVRATMHHFRGGSPAIINIGGPDDGTEFVELYCPAESGRGHEADTISMGIVKTVQVGGEFRGTVVIELSTDYGVTWGTGPSFHRPGVKTVQLAATHLRAYRSGVPQVSPGAPFVNVGGCAR